MRKHFIAHFFHHWTITEVVTSAETPIKERNGTKSGRYLWGTYSASRKGFVPRVGMCRDKDRGILTDKLEVIERWKKHYDEHLNSADEEGQAATGMVSSVRQMRETYQFPQLKRG